MKYLFLALPLAPAAFLFSACGESHGAPLEFGKRPRGLENVEMKVPETNPLTKEKAELGAMLFFDPRLSSDDKTSCSTCHQHSLAWTDGQRFSKKSNGELNTRNSQSLYNVAFQPHFYWDGRAATLEKNVEAAWKAQMGGDPEAVAKTLAGVAGYTPLFQKAFGGPATAGNIVDALASFLRTLLSGDSAVDRNELDPVAKRGQAVFQQRCISCHLPPLYTDFLFHNTGTGEKPDEGRGKIDATKPGAFKTPSLRGVARSKPYFHDGSAAELRDAVATMARAGIDNQDLDPILKAYKSMPALSEQDIDDLVAFLKALDSKEGFVTPTVPK
jgi:cytochrome c peroxidase